MNRTVLLPVVASVAVSASVASAYTIEYRIIERVDNVNYVLPDNAITVRPGSIHRYRLQVRVIPDNDNDALGGFLGWVPGTIVATGGTNFRTALPPDPLPHGRIPPFNFAGGPWSDGRPNSDPFMSLDHVDGGIPLQFANWNCDGTGNPGPEPQATIRGRGEFVSIYEITSGASTQDYTITYAGPLVVGSGWNHLPFEPPDCGDPNDPADDQPSQCIFAAIQILPQTMMSCTLTIHVCPAEWNDDRNVDSEDFFDFIQSFFQNNADFNHDGKTAPDDVYEYIDAFMSSCG